MLFMQFLVIILRLFILTKQSTACPALIGGQKIALRRFGNAEKCKAMSEDVETAANMAVEEIELLNPISDYERLIYLYEYLQDNVLCDIEESKNLRMRRNSRNPMSHNAYGALINKKAVCDGVAAAFALIAQKMGYECIVVSGKATLETTEFSDHSWNIIRIGENYYHIDALWDINKKNQTGHYSYEYFGLNDVAVSIEHQWDITRSPVCGRTDLSFYLHNRCIANSLSQIDEIFERFARSRQGIVRLKVADGIAIPDSEEKYLGNRLLDVVSATGKYRSINFTWNKALRCFFGIMNQ